MEGEAASADDSISNKGHPKDSVMVVFVAVAQSSDGKTNEEQIRQSIYNFR